MAIWGFSCHLQLRRCDRAMFAALSPLLVTVVDNGSIDSTTERIECDIMHDWSRTDRRGFRHCGDLGLALLDGRSCSSSIQMLWRPAVRSRRSTISWRGVPRSASLLHGWSGLMVKFSSQRVRFKTARNDSRPAHHEGLRKAKASSAREAPRSLGRHIRSQCPWIVGAAMMVRRAAIASVGGMDERFFLYYEDQDWSRPNVARRLACSPVPPGRHASRLKRASRSPFRVPAGTTPRAQRSSIESIRAA